jgi:hypothetical protein
MTFSELRDEIDRMIDLDQSLADLPIGQHDYRRRGGEAFFEFSWIRIETSENDSPDYDAPERRITIR